jgi:MFS family permease
MNNSNMAFVSSEKKPPLDEQDLSKIDGGLESFKGVQKKRVKLAPLTLGLCLAVFLLSVDRTIVAVVSHTLRDYSSNASILIAAKAAPRISDQFNSFHDIGWYGSAYLITLCCVQPVLGKVYTVFTTKWTYVLAFIVFEIGSLVCALAPNSAILILGRAIAGGGAGGVLSGSYVITAQTVPMRIRPAYTAAVAMMFSLGAIVAPLVGGALTQHVSWRWCFYINLPVGCPVLLGIALFFRPPNNAKLSAKALTMQQKVLSLDLIGAVLLLGSGTMLLMALQYAAEGRAWSSSLVAGLLPGAAVAAVTFVIWQWHKGDEALIPPRILKQRTVFASVVANIAMYAALVAYIYFLAIYFQAVKGRSIITSAVDLLPLIVCSSVFSIIAGILVTKTLYFTPPAVVGTALAFIGSGLLTTLNSASPMANMAGYQVLVGVGLGLALQTGFFGVQAVLPAKDIPVGTSLMTFAQSLGGALGVSIGNTVLLSNLRSHSLSLEGAGVDINVVIRAGATGFRRFVSGEALTVLLDAYNQALNRVFVMACALLGAAWFATCFMELRKTVESPKKAGGSPDDP